jgi:ABC-type xylose transport system substrate-binding protein
MTEWWEPPFAGTEAEQLLGALDRQRATFRFKTDGLDAAALAATPIPSSALTLGGLLRHLAAVEATYAFAKAFGESPGEPWASDDGPENEWEFASAADDTPAELYASYDGEVARARARVAAAIAADGLDQHVHVTGPDGAPATLRRLLLDLLEEYGRHTGHADLLREALDGVTGEDPTPGWNPTTGGTA